MCISFDVWRYLEIIFGRMDKNRSYCHSEQQFSVSIIYKQRRSKCVSLRKRIPLEVACLLGGLKWRGASPVKQLGKSSLERSVRFSPTMLLARDGNLGCSTADNQWCHWPNDEHCRRDHIRCYYNLKSLNMISPWRELDSVGLLVEPWTNPHSTNGVVLFVNLPGEITRGRKLQSIHNL